MEGDMAQQFDYLIVGAGAMGMAFADSLLSASDATIAIVDRYGKPGGHWTRAYPHVRLHQPSAFYGVNSRKLGSGQKDTRGGNKGLYELASGAEVAAYFDQVMQQQFLPSGRVSYFPMSDYAEGSQIVSRVSGTSQTVSAKTVVDATYSQVVVPSMRPPAFDVAAGVTCLPPNALTTLDSPADRYVVIGAGKTGIDAVLWLLDAGASADSITWIMPRDSWYLDRATIQPGADFFDNTVGGFAAQMEAAALAETVDELFERLEAAGQLLRLDRNIRPTMYRCATVSLAELDQLRAVTNIIRMGHVRAITEDAIVLDSGSVPTAARTLHVDCTADGLAKRPAVPVFQEGRITIQNIRLCQPTFSAALIGHVEASLDDIARKNQLCSPIPYPDTDLDWLTVQHANAQTGARWASEPAVASWLRDCRLDAFTAGRLDGPPTPEQLAILQKLGQYAPAAVDNLARLTSGIAS
jgi:hypothetical protein